MLLSPPPPISVPRPRFLTAIRTLAAGLILISLALLAGSRATLAASSNDLWLHVAVDESDGHGEHVRVTVPLALAQAILPLIDEGNVCQGKVRIDDHDLEMAKLRGVLEALKEAKEGQFIRVEADGEEIEVARSGKNLLIKAEDGDEKVRIRLPLKLVDAFIAAHEKGSGDVDLAAAVKTLEDHGEGELVAVDSDDARVRIWLDRKPEAE